VFLTVGGEFVPGARPAHQTNMLKRTATLTDVGNVAAFVASDQARAMIATEVNISCGAMVD
jgi:3-oxoacyl-[acyl-carrier protein] reductase